MEIVASAPSGTYRGVYTVSIGKSVYVVHAFQKKSKLVTATPWPELNIVRQRLKRLGEELKSERERA